MPDAKVDEGPPERSWRERPASQRVAVLAGIAVAYFAASRLGLELSFPGTLATPVWPPSGIALAAIIVFGWRAWPGVFLGAWLTNVIQLTETTDTSTAGWVVGGAAVAAGNSAEAVFGGIALRKLGVGRRPFDRVKDTFKFVFVGLSVSVVAATVGLTTMAVTGNTQQESALEAWLTWWVGDSAGILVCAPALVAWAWKSTLRWTVPRVFEAVALLVLLVPTGFLLFAWLPDPLVRSLPYLVLPLLLWVVMRFHLREATLAIVMVAGIATWGTVRGVGPFIVDTLNGSLMLVESFIGTVAVSVLLVSSALVERRRMSDALHETNRTLEERVRGRTAELTEANERLSNEVRERERAEETVRHMAQHDSLTGVANRRLLEELFDTMEALARRHDECMALLFIDVDDFKQVNDEFGHDAGDRLLSVIASRMQSAVRESDLVARIGGDEFVVVLPKLGGEEDGMHVARKVREALTEPIRLGEGARRIGVSIGIANYPRDGRDLDRLLQCADEAMYGVKDRGKGGVAVFEG